MRYTRFLFFLIITISLFVLLVGGCDGGGGDSSGQELTRVESVVGPEGGTVEVTDPNSPIYGVKLEIPAGALAYEATIIISQTEFAPSLPAGLISDNPFVDISTDAQFLKDIQITFPIQNIPNSAEGEILSAFIWDTNNANWIVVLPEQINDNKMIIKRNHLSLWKWGTVLLNEVEIETLEPLLDENFGPEYMDRLAEALEIESLKLIDWSNLDYCANKLEIANAVREIKEDAKIRAEEYLQSVNVACNVWDHTPTVNDIFYGINEIIQIHVQYFAQTITSEIWSMVPYIGDILAIMAKASAQALYEQRLGNLKDEYVCIFTNAESELWINVGLYFIADATLLGMELVEIEYPCN